MRRKLLILLVIANLAIPWLFTGVVLAISQPDSDPTVSELHANRNLITSGDICIYGEYNIPYSSTPDIHADDAFIFRLISSDNTTDLGSVSPFVYFDSGYGLGVFSFYFADAATANVTWGEALIIRISENPGQFDSPTYFDIVIPSSAWTSVTSQDDNRVDMAAQIISIAQDMEAEHSSFTFLEQSAVGPVLSAPTGQLYFRGCIPGLDRMAPSIFLVQELPLDVSSANWTLVQSENYSGRFEGTWVDTAQDATATRFGITTGMLMGMVAILPLCLGSIIVSQKKWQKIEPGLIASSLFLIMGFVMSWIPGPLFASIYQILGIYIAYLFFYARSS